ncbi:MAG: tetratricopeptide repeat protein [candidate division WOR-3 bacterium]
MRPTPRPGNRGWLIPAGLLAAALGLRICYLLVYNARLPFAQHPFGDAELYLTWAKEIVAGTAPAGVFYRAPLYPYLVALLLAARSSLGAIYLFQMLLGLGTLVISFLVARRLFGYAAACIALGLLALTAPLPFFETKLLGATLVLFLVTLGTFLVVVAAERRRRWSWFFAGACFGLAAITWPGTLVLFGAVCVWAVASRAPGRKALPLGIAACLGVVLVVTVRNAVVGADLVLISANGGFTFYQGNNRLAAGTLAQPPEVYEFQYQGRYLTTIAEQEEFERRFVAAQLGYEPKPSRISRFWVRRALSWMAANPGPFLLLLARKTVLALSDYESPLDHNIELEKSLVWPLRLAFVRFGMLLALAVLGVFLVRNRRAGPLYAIVAGNFAVPMLFYVADRYRLPMIPALAVLGGAGVYELWRRTRQHRLAAVPVLAATAAFLVSTLAFTLPLRRGSDLLLANAWTNLATAYLAADNPDAARAAWRQAEAIYLRHAATLNRQEQLAAAEVARMLKTVVPADMAQATDFLRHGDTIAAIQLLETSIARDSSDPSAWLLLGSLYGFQQRHHDARLVLSRAVRMFPTDPALKYNLALAAFREKDFRAALAAAEELLKLVPDHEPGRRLAEASRRRLAGPR